MATPTLDRPPLRQRDRTFLPASRLGRWAAGLLLLVVLFPTYWAPLGRALKGPPLIIVVPAAIALPGFVTGAVAMFRRHERSTAVRMLFGLAAAEVVFTALLFLMMALGGG